MRKSSVHIENGVTGGGRVFLICQTLNVSVTWFRYIKLKLRI